MSSCLPEKKIATSSRLLSRSLSCILRRPRAMGANSEDRAKWFGRARSRLDRSGNCITSAASLEDSAFPRFFAFSSRCFATSMALLDSFFSSLILVFSPPPHNSRNASLAHHSRNRPDLQPFPGQAPHVPPRYAARDVGSLANSHLCSTVNRLPVPYPEHQHHQHLIAQLTNHPVVPDPVAP